ncbi:MAG: ABC transporter permease [Cyanobacteria bacterium K_DeepCast_35m_m1_288]|nr:ABC transporter permease [Cyanobacteria bacterium K_DeepCast_35m_m1_288]
MLWRLTQREVAGRYRGSVLGWSWSLLNPLLMLAVYTFVFSTVFKARWPDLQQAGPLGFAINLFAGLIVFNLFAECIGKGPTLIVSQPSYVTKVVFPLELLAATSVGAASFHAATSLVVLGLFELLAMGSIPLTALWLPLVWLPLLLGCLALGWLLSALGVYLRDLPQLVGVGLSVLMFLSAIFYPVTALPERWQPLLLANPLVLVIEQTRRILISASSPSPLYLLIGIPTGLLLCEWSYRLFGKARRGFADVI